jgi:hypothetical protein
VIPDDLRARAEKAATALRGATGKWEHSIGERIAEILADRSPDTGKSIRNTLSLADFNHLQSKVNFLTGLEQTWASATEPWAPPVLRDVREQLTELKAHQAVLIELIQLGWTFRL